MAATFSPTFTIDITDTIPNGQTATVTLPAGSWRLSSVTTTGGAAATITVGTALFPAGVANGATVTLPATDPSVKFTGSIGVTCGGGAQLNDTVLRLTSAIGQSLAVVVA